MRAADARIRRLETAAGLDCASLDRLSDDDLRALIEVSTRLANEDHVEARRMFSAMTTGQVERIDRAVREYLATIDPHLSASRLQRVQHGRA